MIFNEIKKEDYAAPILQAKVKQDWYKQMIFLVYQLSRVNVPFWHRGKYRKSLYKCAYGDSMWGLKLWRDLLEFNSKLESFFFERVRDDSGDIQLPIRDEWRAAAFKHRDNGEWRRLSKTPILEIYSEIIYRLEENEIDLIIKEKNGNNNG
jgi:hypothetical protein